MDTEKIFQVVHRKEEHGQILFARVENKHLSDPQVVEQIERLTPVGVLPGSSATLFQLEEGNYLDFVYFGGKHLKQNVRVFMLPSQDGRGTLSLMTWDPGHPRTQLVFRLPIDDSTVRLVNEGLYRVKGIA